MVRAALGTAVADLDPPLTLTMLRQNSFTPDFNRCHGRGGALHPYAPYALLSSKKLPRRITLLFVHSGNHFCLRLFPSPEFNRLAKENPKVYDLSTSPPTPEAWGKEIEMRKKKKYRGGCVLVWERNGQEQG